MAIGATRRTGSPCGATTKATKAYPPVLGACHDEYAAHHRVGRNAGMTDADVARIVAGPDSPGGDPIDTALLRATNELFDDDAISAGTWATLAKTLDTRQLIDVLVAVGGYWSTSMLINSAGVQLDANMADFRFPPSLR
jgi:alkylhydroperoxidase family enzyme